MGYLCAWGLDPQFCHEATNVPQALLGISLAISVLAALTPMAMSPFLRIIGDESAVQLICVPVEREGMARVAISVLAAGSLAWALSSRVPIPEGAWEMLWLSTLIAANLYFSALTAGAAILICLTLRKVDSMLGRSFVSVVGVAMVVSVIVALGHSPSTVWLVVWFPFALVVGQLTRHIKGVAWKATGLVTALWTVVIVTRAIQSAAERLF